MRVLAHLAFNIRCVFKINFHLGGQSVAHFNSKYFLRVLKNGENLFFILRPILALGLKPRHHVFQVFVDAVH
jgi:hypothetical protein